MRRKKRERKREKIVGISAEHVRDLKALQVVTRNSQAISLAVWRQSHVKKYLKHSFLLDAGGE